MKQVYDLAYFCLLALLTWTAIDFCNRVVAVMQSDQVRAYDSGIDMLVNYGEQAQNIYSPRNNKEPK